ncbi:MAG: hypothetical protein R3B70_19555, partial [Polyangiaceae bacterium]
NSANQVAEYYKLDALSKDRLTVAPQLVNALTLKTSFLLERWQLYKFQNPNGDNSQYKQAACNSADGAVSVLNAVEKQFNDFVPTKITTVYAKKQGFGCGKGCTYTKIVAYCYKDYGTEKCVSGSSVTTKNTATAQRNARVAEVRSKILGDNFNTARTQLTQMGDLCP